MPEKMTDEVRRDFLQDGKRTAVLATTRADGRPHAAPVWFVLHGDDVLFITGEDTVKGKDLLRDPRVSIVVDDETPPYSFVMIEGLADVSPEHGVVRQAAHEIGARYLGPEGADGFADYGSGPGKFLVRVKPKNIVAMANMAG